MHFGDNFTRNHLGEFIFMVCPGNKHEHGPHLHQTGNMDQDCWLLQGILPPRITCTVSKWIFGSVVPCETVCKTHVAQLLLTMSSPYAEQTNLFVVAKPFSKLVNSRGSDAQYPKSESHETKLWEFHYRLMQVWSSNYAVIVFIVIWKVWSFFVYILYIINRT